MTDKDSPGPGGGPGLWSASGDKVPCLLSRRIKHGFRHARRSHRLDVSVVEADVHRSVVTCLAEVETAGLGLGHPLLPVRDSARSAVFQRLVRPGNGTVNKALSSWKSLTAPRPVERTGIPVTGV